jgi:hypothetical protein
MDGNNAVLSRLSVFPLAYLSARQFQNVAFEFILIPKPFIVGLCPTKTRVSSSSQFSPIPVTVCHGVSPLSNHPPLLLYP